MRTINRVIATGALVLPLSFGAAGMAAADTQPVPHDVDPSGVAEQVAHTTEQVTHAVDHVVGKQDLGSVADQPNAPGHHDGTGNASGDFVPF